MKDETCENCGRREEEHPWYYDGGELDFQECKKFTPKNHSPQSGVVKEMGGLFKTFPEDTPSGVSTKTLSEGTFNLSKKMIPSHIKDKSKGGFFLDKDVKEFIKLLKKNINNLTFGHENLQLKTNVIDKIDKLAGEDLI